MELSPLFDGMCTETKSFFTFPILTSRFSLNLNIIPHYVWLLLLSVSVKSYISEGVRCLLLSPSDTGVQYVVWLIKQKTVGLCKNMFLPPNQQVLALLQTSMFVDIDTPVTSPVELIEYRLVGSLTCTEVLSFSEQTLFVFSIFNTALIEKALNVTEIFV